MSELDFDNISSLLDDVLSDKPIGESVPEEQPATPEEVAVAVAVAEPAETDDILGDFLNDLEDAPGIPDSSIPKGVITHEPVEPDSVEAIEDEMAAIGVDAINQDKEVTQCVTEDVTPEVEVELDPDPVRRHTWGFS